MSTLRAAKSLEPVDKIAVDTSIWLRALFFGGSAEELIKMSLTGKVDLVTTESQFADLQATLRDQLGFSENAIAEFRTFMESVTTILSAPAQPAAGPGNDLSPLLLAARDSKASAIATSDNSALINLEEFEGIPIVAVS